MRTRNPRSVAITITYTVPRSAANPKGKDAGPITLPLGPRCTVERGDSWLTNF